MKKFLCLFIILTSSALSFQNTFAQCDTELYSNKAMKNLKVGFTFIRSYQVVGIARCRPNIEYTYLFSKGTTYMIRIAGKDGGANGIVAVLYNSDREELATSFVNNVFYDGWTFNCKATGFYHLNFTFKDSQSYCGAAVLGFRR